MHIVSENYIQKNTEKAALHVKKESLEESALNMLENGIDSKLVSTITQLPISCINALKRN